MASKKKTKRAPSRAGGAAHKIWLAGLGALASAEEEGGKLFERLVRRGRAYRGDAGETLDDAGERVRETVAGVRGRAGETWKRVEHAFDQLPADSRRKLVEGLEALLHTTPRTEGWDDV